MAIRAWVIAPWAQSMTVGAPTNSPGLDATGLSVRDLAITDALNIPPRINVGAWLCEGIPDKSALDALDATPGVIVLAAINDDGTHASGYLRPQDTPSGAQLLAARTRLAAAGIPTGDLTARVQAGMTLERVVDGLRDYAHDLVKDARAQQVKG